MTEKEHEAEGEKALVQARLGQHQKGGGGPEWMKWVTGIQK